VILRRSIDCSPNEDKPNSPGCALAVMKDGRIVYERATEWPIWIMT